MLPCLQDLLSCTTAASLSTTAAFLWSNLDGAFGTTCIQLITKIKICSVRGHALAIIWPIWISSSSVIKPLQQNNRKVYTFEQRTKMVCICPPESARKDVLWIEVVLGSLPWTKLLCHPTAGTAATNKQVNRQLQPDACRKHISLSLESSACHIWRSYRNLCDVCKQLEVPPSWCVS